MTSFIDLEYGMELAARGLAVAIEAAASAALLAAIVFAGSLLFRRWLTAGQRGLLWGLVLIRLAMPLAPETSFGLKRLVQFDAVETAPSSPAVDPLPEPWALQAAPQAGPVLPSPDLQPYAHRPSATDANVDWLEILALTLLTAWMLGLVGSLLWTLVGHWAFVRRIAGVPPQTDSPLIALWTECRLAAGVSDEIPTLLTDAVDQPALLGFWRPRLLLPPECADWSVDDLRMVLLHELGHVRRADVAVNWGLMLVRAVHWWNPVYWLAATQFRSLREQACDAFALHRLSPGAANRYGELLLNLASQPVGGWGWRISLPASLLGFMRSRFRRWSVGRRLRALQAAAAPQPGSRRRLLAAAGIALCAACGLTNAERSREPDPIESTVPLFALRTGEWGLPSETPPGPMLTRVYDVQQILDRCTRQFGDRAIAAEELWSYADNALRCDSIWPRAMRPLDDAQRSTASLPRPLPAATAADESVPSPRLHPLPGQKTETAQPVCHLQGNQLVVSAPRAVHDELQRQMAVWERFGVGQVAVECRLIVSPIDLAGQIGMAWEMFATSASVDEHQPWLERREADPAIGATSAVEELLPVSRAVLDDAACRRLIVAAQTTAQNSIVFAPRITLFSGTLGTVFSGCERPFVVGLKPLPEGDFEPRIAVVSEGTALNFRAALDTETRRVHIDCAMRLSEIEAVRVVKTRIGTDERSIQIPRVRHCQLSVAGEVGEGESLLLGCLPAHDQQQFRYLLLTPRIEEQQRIGSPRNPM